MKNRSVNPFANIFRRNKLFHIRHTIFPLLRHYSLGLWIKQHDPVWQSYRNVNAFWYRTIFVTMLTVAAERAIVVTMWTRVAQSTTKMNQPNTSNYCKCEHASVGTSYQRKVAVTPREPWIFLVALHSLTHSLSLTHVLRLAGCCSYLRCTAGY
jgi:uncharacterized membrane protein YcjF (UPF0283 family)